MTEAEWLALDDPYEMAAWCATTIRSRKWRLWGVACCRHLFWHRLKDDRLRNAVEVHERYLDNLANEKELREAMQAAGEACQAAQAALAAYLGAEPFNAVLYREAIRDAEIAIYAARASDDWYEPSLARATKDWFSSSSIPHVFDETEGLGACRLLREIAGPFRIVALDMSWQTGTTLAVAQTI